MIWYTPGERTEPSNGASIQTPKLGAPCCCGPQAASARPRRARTNTAGRFLFMAAPQLISSTWKVTKQEASPSPYDMEPKNTWPGESSIEYVLNPRLGLQCGK